MQPLPPAAGSTIGSAHGFGTGPSHIRVDGVPLHMLLGTAAASGVPAIGNAAALPNAQQPQAGAALAHQASANAEHARLQRLLSAGLSSMTSLLPVHTAGAQPPESGATAQHNALGGTPSIGDLNTDASGISAAALLLHAGDSLASMPPPPPAKPQVLGSGGGSIVMVPTPPSPLPPPPPPSAPAGAAADYDSSDDTAVEDPWGQLHINWVVGHCPSFLPDAFAAMAHARARQQAACRRRGRWGLQQRR